MVLFWSFLIYWFILFVVTYILVEYGHKFLYGELPKLAPLRVAAASLIMAGLLTWTHSSFETMFTADIKWTVLQAIVWVGVFVGILQFHFIHAIVIGISALAIVTGMATMAVDTLTKPRPDPRTQFTAPNTPLRRPSGGAPAPLPTAPAK